MNAQTLHTRESVAPAIPGRGSLDTVEAFQAAMERYHPALTRYVASRVGVAAAEDVVADTFAAAWRARSSFVYENESSTQAWLLGIATRLIANHRRSELRWLRMCADTAREQSSAALEDDLERAAERMDASALLLRAGIAQAMARMPRRERDVLFLHFVMELPYAEIASALNVPLGTVKSRAGRGRKRLAEMIGEHSHE